MWTSLRLEFESLSHVEQYLVDLDWTETDISRLLATRIEGYLKRTDQWRTASKSLKGDEEQRHRTIIASAFESPIIWGGHGQATRPPHVALYTLSKHRPRGFDPSTAFWSVRRVQNSSENYWGLLSGILWIALVAVS